MSDYINAWYKRLWVSRTQTLTINGLSCVVASNMGAAPGESLAVSDADAVRLDTRIVYKTVLTANASEGVAVGETVAQA